MDQLKPIIARNIAALRQAAGMTQLDLAEALHYSDKAVSKWERGESVPDVSVLKHIADLFHVTVDRLLQDGPVPSTAPAAPAPVPASAQRTRRLITAISLVSVAALALLLYIILRFWPVFLYALPAACIVWLVLNTLWFDRRRNYAIISCMLWTLLLSLCVTLACVGLPVWEVMLLGIPGQLIIWLCSRIGRG